MPRILTLGKQPTEAPPGNFRPIVWPQLAKLDEGTKEGFLSRVLASDGANSRDLPRSVYWQGSQQPGHFGSVAGASLWEITADGETGILSGKGWVADTPEGHALAAGVVSKSLFHNSIDLGDIGPDDIEIIEHGDFWDDDWYVEVRFKRWNLIATTLVGKPAFANAQAEMPEELRAAIFDDLSPLVVDCPSFFTSGSALELTASMSKLPSYDYFFRPEPLHPHKLMVDEPDENGFVAVYGNLAQWGKPHTGIHGRSVYAPRASDGYSTFCQPGVLTDKGLVNTGPVTLLGGHVSLKEAADDPQYAWADVRVVDGRHGPWVAGIARPHITHDDAARYVARASRISGHWETEQGPLRMIVCCNAEGFTIDNPWPEGLVASFALDEPQHRGPIPVELFSFTELSSDAQERIKTWITSGGVSPNFTGSGTTTTITETTIETTTEIEVELEVDDDLGDKNASNDSGGTWDAEAARRERELRLLDLEPELV